MTTQEMLHIAMAQSAEDLGCRPEDFLADGPVLRSFKMGTGARKILRACTSLPEAMPCAKNGRSWMCWGWALMIRGT